MEVRERIRINGKPLAKDKFAKYFFDCWDNLHNNGDVSGQKLLSTIHIIVQAQVHTLILSFIIGGVLSCALLWNLLGVSKTKTQKRRPKYSSSGLKRRPTGLIGRLLWLKRRPPGLKRRPSGLKRRPLWIYIGQFGKKYNVFKTAVCSLHKLTAHAIAWISKNTIVIYNLQVIPVSFFEG